MYYCVKRPGRCYNKATARFAVLVLPNFLAAKLRNLSGSKQALTDQIVQVALQKYFEHHSSGEYPQRRRLERAAANMAVAYSIVGDGHSQNASAINLSGSGVRISSVERLGPGTQEVVPNFG